MNVSEDCFMCLYHQGASAIDLGCVDVKEKEVMYKKVKEYLSKNFNSSQIPAHLGTELQKLVFDLTGVDDPLKGKKKHANDVALSLFDRAEKSVEESEDKLRQSVRIALAGNLIDFAVFSADVDAEVLENALNDPLVIDDCDILDRLLEDSDTVLYICDNAGEIVFDKILIENFKHRGLNVTACVKSGPIVNDATIEDAAYVGLTELCEVITIGAATIGTPLDQCSPEFLDKFENSDLIISKGMANFETLHRVKDKKIVLMLKAKCANVARYFDVEKNSNIVKVLL